ncbi:tetratricopeptide repeat protein [Falsiroseomonas oryziterrae]|uniref:tetratricopeptide repeat protein n=1 Tax=Falsiroseomonas oryziterrae TaxID=2911368 RepID=UPI001F3C4C34|nr:tetratricopeptide repeat protein [Roseomonas sp. NPKOSM-4]
MPPPRTAPRAAPPDLARMEETLRARLAAEPGHAGLWQQLATLLAQAGRPAEAAEAFGKAASLGAPVQPIAVPWALALSAAGRHAEAVEVLRPVQAGRPKDPVLANVLGVMLKRAGTLDEAIAPLELARRLEPRNAAPLQNLGNVHELRGDFAAAAEAFGAGAKLAPRNAELWRLHGRMLRALGDKAGALRSFETAQGLDPRNRDLAVLVNDLLLDRRDFDAAIAAARRLRTALPGDPLAEVMEARTLLRCGEPEAALAMLEAVVARHPGDRNANMLIARIHGDGNRKGANEALERAFAAEPDSAEVMDALVESLSRSRYDSEIAHLERAYVVARRLMERHPDKVLRFARSLRTVFQRVLDTDRLAATGTLDQLGPLWIADNRVSALHYELGQVETLEDRIRIVEWHREWGRREEAAITPLTLPAPAVQGPRKLRVGFMSSDLRNHPVSYFALPLLEAYDRERYEVFCYSFYEGAADQVQTHIAAKVDAFRWWPRRPSAQVAEGIAADGLDILFELGGSTAMNKLEVMAYRPARIGVSWLGYPHSAGLERIDYILTDPFIRPEDPRLLIEKPFEMPESWVVLGRLGFHEKVPIEDGLPEDRRGAVTFGTMNNPYKYTQKCLDAWAAVLRAVPRSRFLFVRPEAAGESFRENAKAIFAARGVEPDRLDFVGVRGAHLQHYNSMDIALDSFPHVGGTTTCETLWMGVPTVTLVGPGFPERLSYSNLNNAGLGDLCARNVEEFVAIAAGLAEDRPRRRALRMTLRQVLREHPLGDAQRFVKAFYARTAEACRA